VRDKPMPQPVSPPLVPVSELRARYPEEWIAVRLPPSGDRYRPDKGYLVAHSSSEDAIWRAAMTVGSGYEVYLSFNASQGPARESTVFFYLRGEAFVSRT
jgi:hypothetical protein